jgi:hypothetical protein
MTAFFNAARSGDIDRIQNFFVSISNDHNEFLIYDSETDSIYMGDNSGLGALKDPVGKVKGIYSDTYSEFKFGSIAMHFLNGSSVFGVYSILLTDVFPDNRHLNSLCTMLDNQIKKKTLTNAEIYTIGGSTLNNAGETAPKVGVGIYMVSSVEHCIAGGLLECGLNYLAEQGLITIGQESSQVPAAAREESSNNHCDSVKEKLEERPYIAFFIIAASALLAGGAIALTTYFHVGTSLMLAGGFIPFLNFVGGFQISLLLGVVTFATACAGIGVAVKKADCCKLECCEGKGSDVDLAAPLDPCHMDYTNR